MDRPQISKVYLQFGGKIRRRRRIKRMRHVRKKGQRGGVFMVPLLASSLALVATKSFKRYTKKKSLNQF